MDARYIITSDHLAALPVFPLPRFVFFPSTALPLHIFEPRYRELVARCLRDRHPLAITCIQPGYEHLASGAPPLEDIATAGFIVQHRLLPDGRYHILLGGMHRVRLGAELHGDTAYRRFDAQIIEDIWPDDRTTLRPSLRLLRTCLHRFEQQRQAQGDPLPSLDAIDDPAILTNALAATLFPDADARQSLLACPEVALRVDRVIDQLAVLLAQGDAPSPGLLN